MDYGGGWSVNKNGTIQVMRPSDSQMQAIGKETALTFIKGFTHRSLPELNLLLSHDDQRVRQAAQFAMVENGSDSIDALAENLKSENAKNQSSLHSIWALGQLYRNGYEEAGKYLISSLSAEDSEIRANAARTCGDISLAISKLFALLT